MLSLTSKAAIKAVVFLASRSGSGEKAGIVQIAENIDASEHTVGKLLQTLVKRQVINSAKGPTGGFYITQAQLKQPIINIIEAIDGNEIFTECGLGLSKCSAAHPCPIHDDYKKGRDILEKLFRSKNILDLSMNVNTGSAFLNG